MSLLYLIYLLYISLLLKPTLCQPTVTLTVPNTISEADLNIQVCIEVSLPSESSSDVSVNATVQTNSGSAMSGIDFAPLNAILFVDTSTGTLMSCTGITVFPDDLLEPREMFTVSGIADIDGGSSVMILDTETVSLLDNTAVTLGFTEAVYTFTEGEPNPEVCVQLLEGVIVRTLPIVLALINAIPGTATQGADYNPISMVRVELDNNTPESGSCVTIPLINDDQLEDMEEFTLSLVSSIGDTLIDDVLNGTDIVIVDDDEIIVSVTPSNVTETDGYVEVCVGLLGSPSIELRNVSLMTQDGTAVASVPGSGLVGDYEPLSVFIVFPVGTTELSMCVNITVNQDNSLEPVPEMFTVLATAGNGDTVPTSPQIVLILDVPTTEPPVTTPEPISEPMTTPTTETTMPPTTVPTTMTILTTVPTTVPTTMPTTMPTTQRPTTMPTTVPQTTTVPTTMPTTMPTTPPTTPPLTTPPPTTPPTIPPTTPPPITPPPTTPPPTTPPITTTQLIECPVLPRVKYGCVLQRLRTVGSVATYSCFGQFGFILTNGDKTRTCQEDGTWSGTAPTCESIECPGLQKPRYGKVRYPRGRRVTSSAYYYCDRGYQLCGSRRRVCQSNKKWTGVTPTCCRRRSYRKQCKGGFMLWG